MAEAITTILLSRYGWHDVGYAAPAFGGQSNILCKLASSLPRPYPTPRLLLLFSLMIMAVSGILAGLLPVQQALKIKAIDAIGDE